MGSDLTALKISGLSKSFGSLVVTEDVSLKVPESCAMGIIGPNGAGKTTLFNLITGAYRQDSGKITFYDDDISNTSLQKRCRMGIARSFQIPQPFLNLSAFENVLTAAAFGQGISERAARKHAKDSLDRCGLSVQSNKLASSLTLLDRKRLELARALATNPKLLMLDEIAGGLTEAECQSLIALIKEINASGTTIIWIEHVLHALLAVVEQVVVLDFGKLIAQGTPENIMKDPQVAEIYLGPNSNETERHSND